MSSSILDNIYCISLEENEDRRENIMKNFPFTINFFKAVNTRKERILQYNILLIKKVGNV